MSDRLHRLTYVSRNLLHGPKPKLEAEITRLLRTARARNAKLEVTGLLLITPDCFAQVLEGPTLAVDEVYGAIVKDSRHTDLTLLHSGPVLDRLFDGWDMALMRQYGTARIPGHLPEEHASATLAKHIRAMLPESHPDMPVAHLMDGRGGHGTGPQDARGGGG
jgi:hypothetical protein